MKIIVDDVYSVLSDPHNVNAMGIVKSVCRARPTGFQYMPRFRKGFWDGYVSLMRGFYQFPSGLVSQVAEELRDNGYKISLVHENGVAFELVKPVTKNCLRGVTLRDYQVDAANCMIRNVRGVAKMATNSGKTEVIASMLKCIDRQSLVIVHIKELMYQTADRFVSRGLKHVGMIGDSVWSPDKITVAMIQTLSNKLDNYNLKDNCVLVVDECHHASSNQMLDVLNRVPGAYRFGFSGTPLRHDVLQDLKLIGSTGNVLVEINNDQLIESGYSAKPTITLRIVETDSIDDWEMEYTSAYDKFIVNNDNRNSIIVDFAEHHDGVVLILVGRIAHGNLLCKLIKDASFINGSDSVEYRKQVIDTMRASTKGVFIASTILDEGVDVPAVDAIVLAGGGNSKLKVLQRLGRGLRKKVGSNTLSVLDFLDDTNMYLLEHSDERIDTYIEEGFEIIM